MSERAHSDTESAHKSKAIKWACSRWRWRCAQWIVVIIVVVVIVIVVIVVIVIVIDRNDFSGSSGASAGAEIVLKTTKVHNVGFHTVVNDSNVIIIIVVVNAVVDIADLRTRTAKLSAIDRC